MTTSSARTPAPPAASTASGPSAAAEPDVDLSVDLGGVTLANPIVTASGTFGSGREIDQFFDVGRLGAVVAKSITREPRQGLPTPRMVETSGGMLNAIGLQNSGIEAWLAEDLPWLRERGIPAIVSLAGNTVDDFRVLAERLRDVEGILAVEANISCPNVEDRGMVFACRTDPTREAVRAVAGTLSVPVLAKLTPDVTDITAIAAAAREAGASGVSLINTLLGMAIDPETGRPRLGGVTGGLSGPAIKPVAVRAVHQVHQALPDLPIVGMGGVTTTTDVVEMIRAGASAVAVGTATFGNPMATLEVLEGLRAWLAERGIERVADLRGTVRLPG